MLNAERLITLIDKKGITQQQLADAIGVSHVSIYYYSIGKKKSWDTHTTKNRQLF